AALEAELGEEPRPSVVGVLVRALVAQGRADARGVERAVPLLDPWDRALVHWLHGGITPQAVAEKLVGAGVIAMPSAAWLEEAAAEWQTDPSPFGVIAHLLEDHLTGFDTESSLELDYRWLVEELARCTAGALELEGVSQRVENGRVEIELIHEGQVTGFSAQIRGDWYDVPAVLDALNGVVAARGARFFPLQTGDQLVMVVYAPTAFAEVAALLHIPLEGDANEAASRGAAYEREVIAKE
ncbi:MAG: hypothetical protein KC731_33655, partial [Myxococcales bacterium]|nr:hypothetical protein [Myxococcales bacterium]